MKKNLKGLFVVAFAFVLLLSLTGCGEQKENNGGGNGTQGGNQQQEQQGGTTAGEKWGDHDLTAYIPEPPMEKIGKVITSAEKNVSYDTTWTVEEAEAYIEKCKNAGFNNSESSNEYSGVYSWTVYNSDKSIRLSISYSSSNNGVLNIYKMK